MLRSKKVYITTVIFFLCLGFLGSILLKLPLCNHYNISYTEALYESISAISSTGISLFNSSTQFTFIGQLIMIILVELGAIGFIALFSSLFTINKKKLKLSDAIILSNETNVNNYKLIRLKIKQIIKYTIVIELLGAWLLSLKLIPIYGFEKGIWYSLFHSISAFCNAGFDLIGNESFLPFQNDVYLNIVMILLMFLGGLGFFVLEDLKEWFCTGKKNKIHSSTKLILYISFLILIIGTILFHIFEPNLSFMDCLFTIVSCRNTGFFTINMFELSEMGKMLLAIFMFIGGGPASNAGGIRVVVVAIMILTTISNLKNKEEVTVFYRSINDKIIRKAITIFVVDLLIVLIGIMIFSLTDGKSFVDTLFYMVSCFSNTGLTTIDVTSLTFAGKIVSIGMMYVGRIAPITFLSLFIPVNRKDAQIKYPEMDIIL